MVIPFSFIKSSQTRPSNSFYFDEINRSISFGDVFDASLFGSNNNFSFVCMFRRNKATTSDTLFSKYNTAGNQRGILFFLNGSGQFRINVSSSGSADAFVVGSVGTYTALSWYHVVLVVDNTQTGAAKFRLYVNGVADTFTLVSGTIPATMAVFNNTAPLRLGAHGTGTSNVLNGFVNYAAFTATKLTAGQAAIAYNSAEPKILSEIGVSCAAEWFNATWGGTNYSVLDNSGNGITGTSVNMINGDHEKRSPYKLVIDIIVDYGQSNADGREPLASLAAARTGQQPGMYITRLATPPTQAMSRINSALNNNQIPTTSGAYAQEFEWLDLRSTYGSFGVVKYAVGGTSAASVAQGGTASNWNVATVGAGSLLTLLKSYITQAITFQSARGYTIRWRFIRYQGEKDAETVGMASNMQANVEAEIADLNAFVGQDCFWYIVQPMNLPVYGTEIGTVRTALANVVAANPSKRRLIDADIAGPGGLMADGIHLNAAGNTAVGQAQVSLMLADYV